MFIPNVYVGNIKDEASLPKKQRSYTGFDNKFFISVLKSINEKTAREQTFFNKG